MALDYRIHLRAWLLEAVVCELQCESEAVIHWATRFLESLWSAASGEQLFVDAAYILPATTLHRCLVCSKRNILLKQQAFSARLSGHMHILEPTGLATWPLQVLDNTIEPVQGSSSIWSQVQIRSILHINKLQGGAGGARVGIAPPSIPEVHVTKNGGWGFIPVQHLQQLTKIKKRSSAIARAGELSWKTPGDQSSAIDEG